MVEVVLKQKDVTTRNLSILLILLLMFFCFAMFTGCEKKQSYSPPPPPKVTVVHPVVQDVIDYVEYTGTLSAVKSVQIKARVEGILEKIYFIDGSSVKKGDLLLQLILNYYRLN